jgi:hypothetical protein
LDLQALPEVPAEMVFLVDQVLQEKTDSQVDLDYQVYDSLRK